MPRNVRMVGGRVGAGLVVTLAWGSIHIGGVAAQAAACGPPAAATMAALPNGGASGSMTQPRTRTRLPGGLLDLVHRRLHHDGGPDGLDAVAAAESTVRWSYAVENEAP